MTQPLFLIGPRGCGKTTVGMALADSLNRRFVDTDQWLQSQLNMTVAVQDCATVRRDPAQQLQLTSVIYLMTAQLDGMVERCNQHWLTGEDNV